MLNTREDNFSFLLFKGTAFKIAKKSVNLSKVSKKIVLQLYVNGQYEVQSNVTNENFKLFLDYLISNNNPNIDDNNIYDFYQLSKEFCIMQDIVNQKKFQQKLEYSLLKSLTSNHNGNDEAIEYVSKNLDDCIKKYSKLMYEIPITCLHNIFFNEKRVLNDHEKAYKFIIGNPDNEDLYVLLKSIDGFKLTTKSFIESITKRDEHCGFYPNIRPEDVDLIIYSLPNEILSFNGTLKQLVESRLSNKTKEEKTFYKKITSQKAFCGVSKLINKTAEFLKMISKMIVMFMILTTFIYSFRLFFMNDNFNRKKEIYPQFKEESINYNDNNDKYEIITSNLINEVIHQLEIQINQCNKSDAKILIGHKNNIANGNRISLIKSGNLFENGHIVKKNATLAVSIYKYLADLGDTNGMMKYANCRKKGIGCNVNITEYEIYIEKAANEGLIYAIYHYALDLYDGTLGKVDKIKASYYFKIGADQNHLECIKRYANMINDGDGIKANKEDAAYYFKLGSELNDLDTTVKYIKYLRTKEINVDRMEEIAIYMKKASDLGDLNSMCEFALMLLNGYGVEINEKDAAILMKKAADRGHINAKIKYGLMLLKGIGIDPDKIKGIDYIKSVKHENSRASFYMNCIKEQLSFDEYIDKELKLEDFDDIILSIVPFSLGIQLINDEMMFLTPKNSSIPIKTSKYVTTVVDNQTTIRINIYAGENSKASKNVLVDSFELNGIPPAPKGVPIIEVTFDVDSNGTVQVSALDISTGNHAEKSFKLPIRSRYLTNNQI